VAVREILLDTNAYAAFKRNTAEAVEVLRHAPLIHLNSVVLGELLSGFAAGTREAQNRQELNLFLNSARVKLLAVDENTADHYAAVYRDLRRKGRPIPTNNTWIAASALQHGLALFTFDAHFRAVDGLAVGRNLADFII
jgi:tRNA(fMet)-specific endonuclease VapC